jgi:hypothetical protein
MLNDGVVKDSFIVGNDRSRSETRGRSWQVNILVHVKTDIQNFSTKDTTGEIFEGACPNCGKIS